MVDVNLQIQASGDDGQCSVAGGNYFNSEASVNFGYRVSYASQRCFFRFDNATIPATAVIDSAILKCVSAGTTSTTTASVKLHFEQADDPAAPTDDTDLLGRSIDAGIDWTDIAAWSNTVVYDSPELKTILQDVIDRGGWNSGQALQVIVIDNGSSTNANRPVSTYDHFSNDPSYLYVSYHLPNQIEESESITISESVTIESDLVREENISVAESVTALLGFDESLPTITQDIEISESITMLRGIGTLPVFSDDITLAEFTDLLLGFDESLPTKSESINITEYAYVDIGPQIEIFESITLSDYGNIQPEFSVADSVSIAEDIEIYRGYWADVDDNFIFTDAFSVFNYTNWLRTNKAKSKERFFFTLTGASDQTTDIEIPVSSVFARKRSDDPTYLQVTIPSFNYSAEIAIRSNGQMIVEMGYEVDGEIALREQILIAELEDIAVYEGPINRSITLSGHKTISYSSNLIALARDEIIYRAVQTRARVFRFSHIDPFLNPGDTVVIGDESMTCNNIIYTMGATRSVMEVREGL